MNTPHNLLPAPLSAAAVRSYINFDGGDQIDLQGSSQAVLQSRGVAAIWRLLSTRGYAYLADEVGMGKTRQALGVIATQFLSEPDSHVVIVCPGRTLQRQWAREWDTFMRDCYKGKDDRLVSRIDGQPLHRPQRYERLSEFAKALLLNEHRIHLLRYSSFRRPIWFGGKGNGDETVADIRQKYLDSLHEIGIESLDDGELNLIAQASGEGWREALTSALNEAYARRIGKLFKSRAINLVTLDEAQYLRHVGNRQNTNLAHVLRGHVEKWHFLSATPLHSGPDDIHSLDTYLCKQIDGHDQGKACASCTHPARHQCPQATHRTSKHAARKLDVVQLLSEFMVRRPRLYVDGRQHLHNKTSYRRYQRVMTSAASDPFLALSMAVVQKHLVHVLDGQSNRFRQGECSSFESLSASVKRMSKDRDGNPHLLREIDHQETRSGKPPEETVDRSLINRLNANFFQAMQPGVKRSDPPDPRYNLPHAKLNQVAESLAARSLHQGALHKTLVFVRRIDTVNELVLSLMSHFQQELDGRLAIWHELLSAPPSGFVLREKLWPASGFWNHRAGDDNEQDDEEETLALEDGEHELAQRTESLPYFAALKKAAGKQVANGLLASFQSRLLASPTRSVPFAGFLLHRAAHPGTEQEIWGLAEQHWRALLAIVWGESSLPEWLDAAEDDVEGQWKIATLKRCLLQSMRHSEFLVELYILNRYLRTLPGAPAAATLAEKLLALLRQADGDAFPASLRLYLKNWTQRLRLWIEHFDLIVDKCLRKEDARGWQDIHDGCSAVFSRMAPVVGRSGMLSNINAVPQFNFPTYPNILVCTDVLKEGVDMHLFCHEIVHYGVAWTSGDLEQRIGRIDRFGSQTSRRLKAHKGETEQPLPRLAVEFPYFDGTLDKYQVERVMLAKVKSDLRMDLGKLEEEIGHISISRLDNPEAPEVSAALVPEQYPAEAKDLLDDGAYAAGRFALQAPAADAGIVHRPELDALVVRIPQAGEHPLLRQSAGSGKKSKTVRTFEYLVPLARRDAARPTVLRQQTTFAVTALPDPGRFTYLAQWNTLAQQVSIANPFADGELRQQTVLLERLQDLHLLRTPVARINGDAADKRWKTIVAEENRRRRWGYLIMEQDVIWFAALVMPAGGAWLDKLGERVAKVGDRLQHLHTKGGDHEDWHFRAIVSIDDILDAYRSHFENKRKDFMTRDITDLQAHGRLLAGAHQWLAGAFAHVLELLYGEDGDQDTLKISPVTLLANGVLHIRTSGRERFTMEAYLDLQQEAPCLIWQVVTSTNTRGSKPELDGEAWNYLPHLDDSAWRTERDERSAATASFMLDDKERRYAVLYHPPAKWDEARAALSGFFASLLERLRTTNFQQKHTSNAFFSALNDR